MRWMALTALCLVCSCSGGNGNPDSGDQDSGIDAGADKGFDAGPDQDGQTLPDEDLGDDLALRIPAGTQACTINFVYVSDLAMSFETKGRVTFREGFVRLPTEPGDFERDWIESLEAGPDGETAVPDGPGSFNLSMFNGDYNYLYTRNYLLDGQAVTLSFGVLFEPGERVVTIDEYNLTHGRFGNFHIEFPSEWKGHFSTCLYTYFHCVVREFQIEGGDTLKLEQCNYCPSGWICKADPGVMPRLLFVSGAEERLVEDPFYLAHSMRHHNWGMDFLVHFENPVGPVHGLHLGTEQYPGYENFTEIYYLDENFELIETKAITQQDTKPEW